MSTPARKRPLSSPTEPVAKNRSVRVRTQNKLPESLFSPSPRTTTPVSARKTPAREAALPNVTKRTPRISSRPPISRSRPQNTPTTPGPTSGTRHPVVPVLNTKPPPKEPIRRSPRTPSRPSPRVYAGAEMREDAIGEEVTEFEFISI